MESICANLPIYHPTKSLDPQAPPQYHDDDQDHPPNPIADQEHRHQPQAGAGGQPDGHHKADGGDQSKQQAAAEPGHRSSVATGRGVDDPQGQRCTKDWELNSFLKCE